MTGQSLSHDQYVQCLKVVSFLEEIADQPPKLRVLRERSLARCYSESLLEFIKLGTIEGIHSFIDQLEWQGADDRLTDILVTGLMQLLEA